MNQERIGKFIAECRKKQNLTQEELAEKLGITYKAVSKWECGKGLPDASIMLELCNILNITVNDLLSGEKVLKEHYQEKLEENIIETIDYTDKRINEKSKLIALIIMIGGIGITFNAFSIFPTESSWASIYSIIGLFISLIGFILLNKRKTLLKKLLLGFVYVLLFFSSLLMVDYINVTLNKIAPRFSYLIKTGDKLIIYKAPFYNVYRVNRNTKNEYYIIDTNNKYTENNIPITPFNRDKAGIDNIIKYKNKYIGNNSNMGNLINSLPLREYGYVFKIDSGNLGLDINYHITDWYVNENHYLEKSLLYNSISIFALIDNIKEVTFNFSGKSYKVNRNLIEEVYASYNEIVRNGINKDNFNKYVEDKMNDDSFVINMFQKLFIN